MLAAGNAHIGHYFYKICCFPIPCLPPSVINVDKRAAWIKRPNKGKLFRTPKNHQFSPYEDPTVHLECPLWLCSWHIIADVMWWDRVIVKLPSYSLDLKLTLFPQQNLANWHVLVNMYHTFFEVFRASTQVM